MNPVFEDEGNKKPFSLELCMNFDLIFKYFISNNLLFGRSGSNLSLFPFPIIMIESFFSPILLNLSPTNSLTRIPVEYKSSRNNEVLIPRALSFS